MNKNLETLKALDRTELLNIPLNTFGDFELLDLAAYFHEGQDEDREMAVFELILRSPLNDDELVAYEDLYPDLINYYQRKKNFPAMLYWAAAQVGYMEQNDRSLLNLRNSWRDLAEAYLWAGEINSGLGIFTRLINRYPGDVWNYNVLGLILPHIGLNSLAVETLDRGLALIKKKDPEKLRKQFQELRQEAQANLANGQDQTDLAAPETLQAFRAALALPNGKSTDENGPLVHLSPLDRLIALDREGEQSLDREILQQGQVFIPELIHLGMDEELIKRSLGPWHAARLLNELRSGVAPELEALANWLDRTSVEDWQPWMGAKKFGKIGGYTAEELQAFARNPQNGGILRDSAVHELVERTNQETLARSQTIPLLRDLLDREGADQASEESFTADLICNALDLDAKELLPDIQRAFAEDRVDQKIVTEADVYEELGLPAPPRPPRRTEGLYLRLECSACGRTREHFTRFVIIDQTTFGSEDQSKRSPYILDHEVVCPKCGAVEQYKLEPSEFVKLMQMDPIQLASILLKKKPAKAPKPTPYVYMARGEAFGRPMHPLDTIEEYRRRIARNPHNGELYMKLGNTLRFIGRFEQALEAYRKAVQLAPNDPEILIPAATAEHDFGDSEAARKLYEHCIAKGQDLAEIVAEGMDENAEYALDGLSALNKGQMSNWVYPLKNVNGQPLAPPKRQLAEQPVKKDERIEQPVKKDKRKRHKKK